MSARTTVPSHAPVEVPARQSRSRVLVVDDVPQILAVLTEIISEHHDVAGAGSVDEAVALLAEPFDVILCDLSMPVRSGMDLYDWVREHRPELSERVVFMTGGVFTPEARTFLAGLGRGYLKKPFEEEDVLATVARVVERTPSL